MQVLGASGCISYPHLRTQSHVLSALSDIIKEKVIGGALPPDFVHNYVANGNNERPNQPIAAPADDSSDDELPLAVATTHEISTTNAQLSEPMLPQESAANNNNNNNNNNEDDASSDETNENETAVADAMMAASSSSRRPRSEEPDIVNVKNEELIESFEPRQKRVRVDDKTTSSVAPLRFNAKVLAEPGCGGLAGLVADSFREGAHLKLCEVCRLDRSQVQCATCPCVFHKLCLGEATNLTGTEEYFCSKCKGILVFSIICNA
jgi:hypothetical protein